VERHYALNGNEDGQLTLAGGLDPAGERKRRGYPVMVGHSWSNDLVNVLVDVYFPFIDQGYELDGLVNHFIGGQGFGYEHPTGGDSPRRAKP
jgi:hypothetical protein